MFGEKLPKVKVEKAVIMGMNWREIAIHIVLVITILWFVFLYKRDDTNTNIKRRQIIINKEYYKQST